MRYSHQQEGKSVSTASQDRSLPTEHESRFIIRLLSLLGSSDNPAAKPDRAALAALRRGLGKRPGEVAEMFPYIIPWCASMPDYDQNNYFLVASLFALHQGRLGPHPTVTDARRNSMGASFKLLHEKTNSGSIEKRFVALLNASHGEIDYHLRHAVSVLRANAIGVDWAQLLHDLGGWGWTSRSVQRRWAQGYWQTPATLATFDTVTASNPTADV